jgi:hypothetical protein
MQTFGRMTSRFVSWLLAKDGLSLKKHPERNSDSKLCKHIEFANLRAYPPNYGKIVTGE